MLGIARAPGTCGELVQGKLDGTNLLVTCPVDLYSVVTVQLNKTGNIVVTDNLPKVKLAVERTLQFFGKTGYGAEITVFSQIPCGKGMASSTADIAAACAAAAKGLDTEISDWDIAGIALSIEPTDGLMFPGITVFDHIGGRAARILGPAPEMEILIIDLGGTVDTVGFNAKMDLDVLNIAKENKIALAMAKIEKGLAVGNCQLIGQAATESAYANQHMLPKPDLDRICDICRMTGGLGVNVAHSGTVIGVLFEAGTGFAVRAREVFSAEGFDVFCKTRIINGGIDVLEERAGDKFWKPLNIYTEETYGRLRKGTG
ncbi:GHMP family kinase ATP-binding protein [Phosphitispora fastidiosa]|uniref:GHMP family kinase ATP-binding protein n=1 Tax=Phosphitispora fastidiosa TaxID=2837202 RepID=UPI001E4C449D|nr:GHMP kinase [Phosphitispora fastidiosa]MBU7005230.1 L-threonine kinase [Phosphitispora fastidiosa]